MFRKIIFLLPVLIQSDKMFSQGNLSDYLKNNAYPLALNQPPPEKVNAVFSAIAKDSKIIFLGESGSHYLKFYAPLEAYFLITLNRVLGVKTFLIEGASAAAFLCNKYLQTGDTTYLPKFKYDRLLFWKLILQYNQAIPVANRLKVIGVDFESPSSYFKALNYLLPEGLAPEKIASEAALIKSNTQPVNCGELLRIDKRLKKSLQENTDEWKKYTGANFSDLYTIISNEGSCKDVYRDRNKNLKKRFLAFDAVLNEPIYYAEFGQAHTALNGPMHFAALLNNDRDTRFYNKVTVINTYCRDCTTTAEPVSNWVLEKMEKDVQAELVPLANANFTLFDFSRDASLTEKYFKYGQLLLIVKNKQ